MDPLRAGADEEAKNHNERNERDESAVAPVAIMNSPLRSETRSCQRGGERLPETRMKRAGPPVI